MHFKMVHSSPINVKYRVCQSQDITCTKPIWVAVSRPSDSWVIDQNNILTALVCNLKTAEPTKISMAFSDSTQSMLISS